MWLRGKKIFERKVFPAASFFDGASELASDKIREAAECISIALLMAEFLKTAAKEKLFNGSNSAEKKRRRRAAQDVALASMMASFECNRIYNQTMHHFPIKLRH